MNTSAHKNQSLKIVGLFCLAVGVLVVVSLLFKLGTLLSKSSFDGQHRFTLLEQGKSARLYSFAPDEKTISILDIGTATDPIHTSIEKSIKIPIDAVITSKNTTAYAPTDYLQYVFLHYTDLQTNTTPIDLFRLWLFATSVDQADIIKAKLSASDMINTTIFDNTATKLFSNLAFEKEDKSIQVINGTGISGFGNDFSRILTNSGANVISVITGRTESPKTTIRFYGQPSYTVQKIEKILKKKGESLQKKGISDIIITLGKDTIAK